MKFTLVVLVALSLTLTWQASVIAGDEPHTCWSGETQTEFVSTNLVMGANGRIENGDALPVHCD